jgi:hypothetical protein
MPPPVQDQRRHFLFPLSHATQKKRPSAVKRRGDITFSVGS